MTTTYDLDLFRTYPGAKVFSGRPRGEEVRRQLGLAKLDAARDNAVIRIPNDTYTFNMSFLLGLCGESVAIYGPDEFTKHYTFQGPEVILKDFPEYILQAVKESIPLLDRRKLG
jgi:hypothetical protein